MDNVCVTWTPPPKRWYLERKSPDDKCVLRKVNLNFSASKLYVIAGPVGSGKSTLLKTILQELHPNYGFGSIKINGSVSYASQEPWLFPGTVRSNILFCEPFDEERYARVVRACALHEDFESLPDGDKTNVGDRGSTLSGGQRVRVNLARALYREVDIYLIDDALASVDVHVGKYIFDKCINDLLKEKIRILVSNDSRYFKEADEIVIINNSTVDFCGIYENLETTDYDLLELPINSSVDTIDKPPILKETPIQNELELTFTKRKTITSQSSDVLVATDGHEKFVYWRYFRAGGSIFRLLLLAVVLVFAQVSISGCDYWLAHWIKTEETRVKVNANPDNSPIKLTTALVIFAALLLISIFMWTISSFLFYNVCTYASKNLHNNMFSHLIKAPMRFFDLNPPGRILNRFSKDIGLIDETLPTVTLDALQVLLMIVGVAIQVAVINWWSIFPMIITVGICWKFKNIYLPTAQTIRRLESTAKSPVFSHVSSTVPGLITIRSSKAQERLIEEFDSLQDVHTAAHYLNTLSSSAFGFWLDIVAVILLAFVVFSFLIVKTDETFAGIVGLAITQILLLYGKVQYGLRQTTDMMTHMISVERIFQFTNLEQEGSVITEFEKTNSLGNWPDKGEIQIDHLYLKYSDEEEPVLKDISLNIRSYEKIGIVGRTGSGKTSLVSSLFRLVNPDGYLYIDNISIKTVGLHDLRSKISIIPQDPVLFTTTVRNNLDPSHKYSEKVLWQALEDVELKGQFNSLNSVLENRGNNLSTGQKQLLCLARAIIANNKILILDEATANIDPFTEEIIKKTIKRKFLNCTILTVAHRLSTVLDSDRILVMDEGRVVEFDNLQNLSRKGGYFSTLMRTS